MKKIALVNQRYGLEVNGGSEYYTRLIAERLTDEFQVDIITTKALDYTDWNNYYTADEEDINGVHVKRFPTQKCRAEDFNEYNGEYLSKISNGHFSEEEEKIWFEKQGPYCPAAIEFIKENRDNYDAFIFVTYLYYLTVMGMPEVAEKSVFIPTAHEEPFIHFKTFEKIFNLPKAFVFLTDEEKDLVQNLFNCRDIPCEVMGTGVEIPCKPDENAFRKKFGIEGDYIIYVGRIDEGKDCPMMFKYFMEYKSRRPESRLKLILMGKPVCRIPKHGDIISLGFVSEEDKFSGISGAKALVLPSKFESLSISVLEAMTLSVPVIVNGVCEVLKGHCVKSNGGLYYMNYFEFEGILDYIFSHDEEYALLCRNAENYIEKNYRWDVIMRKFKEVIEHI
ncbi:MAG: glycosyltransferase family 4 protein [Ruminococcus flavefaciens]|nr:glycosyltransferase family 4 protein [Ruminococcus flavefaciens]MCM1360353.1 glycosyltransferase family 4 protein [Clostridiales bacterium]MCM1434747.1 glycosyltransferase family 4 protein [Ruminococcus flavefaciens]